MLEGGNENWDYYKWEIMYLGDCVLSTKIKPIGCIWIFKIKFHVDVSMERLKAMLVAKGYNQIEGMD